MNEHSAKHVLRDANLFQVGSSVLRWSDDRLEIDILETCSFWPHRLRGRVVVTPTVLNTEPVTLAAQGGHFWQVVVPDARATVIFEEPHVSWEGHAYHDMNWGAEPLEHRFRDWTWLRAQTKQGTQVIYDATRRDGIKHVFSKVFGKHGSLDRHVPPLHQTHRGYWGMARPVRSDDKPTIRKSFEDTPFYTRSHVAIDLDSERCEAVHESLSLDRFAHPIMQRMLPYKMPRIA